MARTLSEKVWDDHVVRAARRRARPALHRSAPRARGDVAAGVRRPAARRAARVRRPDLTVATMDHNVPTAGLDQPLADPISAKQMEVLARNCAEFGIRCYAMGDPGQGIVHVIGPEQGLTQPGMTIVCGDSHTSTHGAFGALAFGIGTSEVEHVLATQTLPQMRAGHDGDHRRRRPARRASPPRTSCSRSSPASAPAAASARCIEYRGAAIRALSMEGRMTVCNMSIEAGARAGLIAPDDTTFAYLEGRPFAPKGADVGARARRRGARSSPTTTRPFDKEVVIDATTLRAARVVGHEPEPDDHDRRRSSRPRFVRRCRRARSRRSARSRTWA